MLKKIPLMDLLAVFLEKLRALKMSSLGDFSLDNPLRDTFTPATDKADFTLIDRAGTDQGSPIVVSFDLPFKSVNQATLKTFLISAEGFGIGDFKNEFRLSSFTLNGKRFEVSDPKNSINIVDKLNDTNLNKTLNPIGAGFVLPNAEISAILTVIGERDPFSTANLPNVTQLTKKVEKITGKIASIGTIALIAIIIIGIVLIIAGVRVGAVKKVVS
jgi:type IV secretory pathway VirB2 component (pilin)